MQTLNTLAAILGVIAAAIRFLLAPNWATSLSTAAAVAEWRGW